MSRRTYVYDPTLGKMVEGNSPPRSGSFKNIMGDIPDFVSPVDGTVVHGRASLREHNLRNGVTNIADFRGEWKKAEQKRAEFLAGKADREGIRKAITQALEK